MLIRYNMKKQPIKMIKVVLRLTLFIVKKCMSSLKLICWIWLKEIILLLKPIEVSIWPRYFTILICSTLYLPELFQETLIHLLMLLLNVWKNYQIVPLNIFRSTAPTCLKMLLITFYSTRLLIEQPIVYFLKKCSH